MDEWTSSPNPWGRKTHPQYGMVNLALGGWYWRLDPNQIEADGGPCDSVYTAQLAAKKAYEERKGTGDADKHR